MCSNYARQDEVNSEVLKLTLVLEESLFQWHFAMGVAMKLNLVAKDTVEKRTFGQHIQINVAVKFDVDAYWRSLCSIR